MKANTRGYLPLRRVDIIATAFRRYFVTTLTTGDKSEVGDVTEGCGDGTLSFKKNKWSIFLSWVLNLLN